MGTVAPKPAHSTHPYSKLLGFLAFSHDSPFSTLSFYSLDSCVGVGVSVGAGGLVGFGVDVGVGGGSR